jgi:hypothetical protein
VSIGHGGGIGMGAAPVAGRVLYRKRMCFDLLVNEHNPNLKARELLAIQTTCIRTVQS